MAEQAELFGPKPRRPARKLCSKVVDAGLLGFTLPEWGVPDDTAVELECPRCGYSPGWVPVPHWRKGIECPKCTDA